MQQFVQSLEHRVFMSASPSTLTTDVEAVHSDRTATRAALNSLRSTAVAVREAIAGELKSLNTSSNRAANNRLLASLIVTGNRGFVPILIAESRLLAMAHQLSAVAAAHGKQLLNHPQNVVLQQRVSKDIAALNTKIPIKLTALETALTDGLNATGAVLGNIATANPSIASDVQAGEGQVGGMANAFAGAATQVAAAAAALATDLGTIVG